MNVEILTREVEEQIENSKNGKAAGFDCVPNEILKLARNALSALIYLIRCLIFLTSELRGLRE